MLAFAITQVDSTPYVVLATNCITDFADPVFHLVSSRPSGVVEGHPTQPTYLVIALHPLCLVQISAVDQPQSKFACSPSATTVAYTVYFGISG